jgi:hypothetical protein
MANRIHRFGDVTVEITAPESVIHHLEINLFVHTHALDIGMVDVVEEIGGVWRRGEARRWRGAEGTAWMKALDDSAPPERICRPFEITVFA